MQVWIEAIPSTGESTDRADPAQVSSRLPSLAEDKLEACVLDWPQAGESGRPLFLHQRAWHSSQK